MIRRKGIILAGGCGTRLHPMTIAVSKQLLPVYNKPMIHYPISVLMLAGIREMLIITTPDDVQLFKRLLGDGSQWGVHFTYAAQPKPDGLAQAFIIGEEFIQNEPCVLVLGDNLLFGNNLMSILRRVNQREKGATIFAYPVAKPEAYGVVELDSHNNIISLEEKPKNPKSNYAVPGIYFYDKHATAYAKALKPSHRGELEITDLHQLYLEAGDLHVERLGRGIAWLDTGTPDTLLEASTFVQILEKRQGLRIACLDEIAKHQGWV